MIKVLSLFDGISVTQQALKELRIDVGVYYASEIDKWAIKTTQKNFPYTIQVGDVKNLHAGIFKGSIDLLSAGSPCQDLSLAKNFRKGLEGARSGLFWEFVRVLEETQPKYFLLENVASMPQEANDLITKTLGVEPIMIDASLLSAQSRKRLFWTNIPGVVLPEDNFTTFQSILEPGSFTARPKSQCILSTYYKENVKSLVKRKKNGLMVTDVASGLPRKLTPEEFEKLQCLPCGYTAGCSNTQRYRMLGNAFNKEVIKHILGFIP